MFVVHAWCLNDRQTWPSWSRLLNRRQPWLTSRPPWWSCCRTRRRKYAVGSRQRVWWRRSSDCVLHSGSKTAYVRIMVHAQLKWNWNETNETVFYCSRRTHVTKHEDKNAKTAVKLLSCFSHAVLHMDFAYCWNVSMFYFTYSATAKIEQNRRLEMDPVLLFFISVRFELCGYHKNNITIHWAL